jgi:hypothetical protein
MSNMAYCRFRNTLNDLYDCFDQMDEDLSEEESEARKKLINLCKRIADDADDYES